MKEAKERTDAAAVVGLAGFIIVHRRPQWDEKLTLAVSGLMGDKGVTGVIIACIWVLTGTVHQVNLNTVRARGFVSPRALLLDTNHPVKRMDPDPTYVLFESSVR